MIDIESITRTFDTKKQKAFINYLSKKNKRNDTKNIQLFKLLIDDNYDKKNTVTELYGSDNKNAYHGLRNRLFDSLIDFTANKNLEHENSIDIQIIKYILASRTFLLQKNFPTAYKLLDKAEKLADENSLFPILNEVYHTKIQYASEYPKVNLEILVKKQEENRKKHQLEDELNIVYANLKAAIKSISYDAKIIDFENMLKQSLKDSKITLNESLSFKSLYQILQIVNISAFITLSYYEIEDFVLKSYAILKQKKESNKQLYYQIQIVYIIGNTLFRNRKFIQSLDFMKEMEDLMLLNKKQYYRDFIQKKILVEALNLNYCNQPQKAILKIEDIINKEHNDTEVKLDLSLCLIMFYFQQNNIKKARHILSKMYHTDKWYTQKAGIDWTIKKNIVELLIYVELQEDNLFFSRLRSFRKTYRKYLIKNHQEHTLTFLKITEEYYRLPEIIEDPKFKTQIKNNFSTKTISNEDIFNLSFFSWLESKIKNKPLYDTTLSLVSKT